MTIKKENVKYISLEGGGGAGNGYIGALNALLELDILQYNENEFRQTNIEGFAGASAGAITSVFLACGFTPMELQKIMKLVDFEEFFDLGDVGEIPSKGGFVKKNQRPITEPAILDFIKKTVVATTKLGKTNKTAIGALTPTALLSGTAMFPLLEFLFGNNVYKALRKPESVITILALIINFKNVEKLPEKLKTIIKNNPDKIATTIYNDWGIFLGKKPRIFVQSLINFAKRRVLDKAFRDKFINIAKLAINDPNSNYSSSNKHTTLDILSDLTEKYLKIEGFTDLDEAFNNETYKNLKKIHPKADPNGTTFKEFYEIFKIDLVIMGTNLETTKSHAFSVKTTPDFYVEDAVRISMSLPMVYKPFIYDGKNDSASKPESEFLNGVWIDGGYLNNSPLNIFEAAKTIGLRIEQGGEPRVKINDIFEYLLKWPLLLGVFGTGEAHISQTMSKLKGYNTIIIDTQLKDGSEIGLFDFKPDKGLFEEVNKFTYQAVIKYFK